MKIVGKIVALVFLIANLDAAEAPPQPPKSPVAQSPAPVANQKMLPLPVAGLGTVNIPFDLNAEDPIALATFSEAINTQLAANPAFILARVTTVFADGRRNVEYYEAPGINYHLYGANNLWSADPAEIRLYGKRSPLQAPIEWPIHYFIIYDAAGSFEYLCSDYDLNMRTNKNNLQTIFNANYGSDPVRRIKGQSDITNIYFNRGINQNLPLAKKHLEKLAVQNINQEAKFTALNQLDRIYFDENNYPKAREYYERVAAQNVYPAAKNKAIERLKEIQEFESKKRAGEKQEGAQEPSAKKPRDK